MQQLPRRFRSVSKAQAKVERFEAGLDFRLVIAGLVLVAVVPSVL